MRGWCWARGRESLKRTKSTGIGGKSGSRVGRDFRCRWFGARIVLPSPIGLVYAVFVVGTVDLGFVICDLFGSLVFVLVVFRCDRPFWRARSLQIPPPSCYNSSWCILMMKIWCCCYSSVIDYGCWCWCFGAAGFGRCRPGFAGCWREDCLLWNENMMI